MSCFFYFWVLICLNYDYDEYRKLMEAGFSKNWQELLQEVTGTDKLDASAIKEYFKPLTVFLEQLRQKEGYPIGWSNTEYEKFYTTTSS